MKAESPGRRRAVSIRGETVVKIQEPGASRRERLRTLAGREVAQQTGLFVVPEIVSFDDSRGEIVFERLQLTELRRALSETGRSMELARMAAEALAAIHGRMESCDGVPQAQPGGTAIGQKRGSVPLHGDFGMRNVFYLSDSDRIAVIDWANADWIGVDTDLGVPEVDVAVFLISLFHRRVLGPYPISRRHEVARHFLASYAAASPQGLDIEALSAIVAATTPAFARLIRRRKGTLRALGSSYAMIDLDLFLRRLARRG